VYKLDKFNQLRQLTDTLAKVEGVSGVLGIPRLIQIEKDTVNSKFVTAPIFKSAPRSQRQLDSLMRVVNNIEFYKGQIISPRSGATLLAVTLDPAYLNSNRRQAVMNNILGHAERFEKTTGIKMHYAGLPYVRSTMTSKVAGEMKFFAMLVVLVMGVTLFMFFRTWSAVVFPLLVVVCVMICCVGSIVLLGYKINLLTGLIPSILVVIGVPNCTYLLSRYHYDYRKSGNQILAMTRVIRKIGLITLMNNTTTAIGFVVFTFTDIAILYHRLRHQLHHDSGGIYLPAAAYGEAARAPRFEAAAGYYSLPRPHRAAPPRHRVPGGTGPADYRRHRHQQD
jgi:predicted RND superfamily exporter protein